VSEHWRLERQIEFIKIADRLKSVIRSNRTIDGSRLENAAEHSWSTALMAYILAEYSNEKDLNVALVCKMLLIHDVVEVEAGDTLIYDRKGIASQWRREQKAADRVFGILPSDQGEEWRRIWREFEESGTPEARFARAVDRLSAVLANYFNNGGSWREFQVKKDEIIRTNSPIHSASKSLGKYVMALVSELARVGHIEK
jgi:putative hydrolase of HD superfamily